MFQVDHFLGKESVDNILALRFVTWSSRTCSRYSVSSRWSRRLPVGEAATDEKAKVFEALKPLDPGAVVRGQYRGYQAEPTVAPD